MNSAKIQPADSSRPGDWQPYREPILATLIRTGLIALVIGLVVARLTNQPAAWPKWLAFALWFSFGGHWIELFFLNWLRSRLPAVRGVQIAGRLLIWIVGGTVLIVGARLTMLLLNAQAMRLPPWWVGGLGFIGIELLAHTALALRRQPNFYNGRG